MRRASQLREVARSIREYNLRVGLAVYRPTISRRPNTCIFCGGAPVNGEHIWPVWSHPYLPKGKNKWFALHATRFQNFTSVNVVKHAGDPHDKKIYCVDEKCNNGWMREIENSVRPILLRLIELGDGTTRITEDEQKKIGLWIGLKAIVSEYEHLAHRISHHTYRRQLKEKLQLPPKTWRIWIGSYKGREASILWINSPHLLLPDAVAAKKKSKVANYYNGESLTYVFGELLIHILKCPYEHAVQTWRFRDDVSSKLRQIWPLTGLSIVWPPPNITDEQAHFIARSFTEFLMEAKSKFAKAHAKQNKPR